MAKKWTEVTPPEHLPPTEAGTVRMLALETVRMYMTNTFHSALAHAYALDAIREAGEQKNPILKEAKKRVWYFVGTEKTGVEDKLNVLMESLDNTDPFQIPATYCAQLSNFVIGQFGKAVLSALRTSDRVRVKSTMLWISGQISFSDAQHAYQDVCRLRRLAFGQIKIGFESLQKADAQLAGRLIEARERFAHSLPDPIPLGSAFFLVKDSEEATAL